jgi:hypothetical protein
MFVSFYTVLKQMLNIFWTSTPTNFSYEPPLLITTLEERCVPYQPARYHFLCPEARVALDTAVGGTQSKFQQVTTSYSACSSL